MFKQHDQRSSSSFWQISWKTDNNYHNNKITEKCINTLYPCRRLFTNRLQHKKALKSTAAPWQVSTAAYSWTGRPSYHTSTTPLPLSWLYWFFFFKSIFLNFSSSKEKKLITAVITTIRTTNRINKALYKDRAQYQDRPTLSPITNDHFTTFKPQRLNSLSLAYSHLFQVASLYRLTSTRFFKPFHFH